MAFETFISYSTRDISRAREIKRLLERTRCKVFLADSSIEPGASLDREIIAAISRCDLFVLLWSHHALGSEWVPQEIGIAKAKGKPIIPVVLHKSASPTGFLRGSKYLPLYQDPASALRWLQQNVFLRATQKQKRDGLTWLGLGAVLAWALSNDERGDP
jgi:hypothetical protein